MSKPSDNWVGGLFWSGQAPKRPDLDPERLRSFAQTQASVDRYHRPVPPRGYPGMCTRAFLLTPPAGWEPVDRPNHTDSAQGPPDARRIKGKSRFCQVFPGVGHFADRHDATPAACLVPVLSPGGFGTWASVLKICRCSGPA